MRKYKGIGINTAGQKIEWTCAAVDESSAKQYMMSNFSFTSILTICEISDEEYVNLMKKLQAQVKNQAVFMKVSRFIATFACCYFLIWFAMKAFNKTPEEAGRSVGNAIWGQGQAVPSSNNQKLDWWKNIKVVAFDADAISDDIRTYNYRYDFSIENIGNKNIKSAQVNLHIKDSQGNVVINETKKFLYNFENSFKPKECKKVTIFVDRINGKDIDYYHNVSYDFDILEYE